MTESFAARTRSGELARHVGERVQVAGWLHALRRLGGVTFILVRDGWGVVQAVTEEEADLAPLAAANATNESIVTVSGVVVANEQAPGGLELHQPLLTVVNAVAELLPAALHKRQLGTALPTLLDHATVLNRHPQRQAIFRLAAAVMAAFRRILTAHHFTEVQTPKLVASATESGANVFAVDYFGQQAYLAQSPQFYKQIMVGVFERVFEVGPVFRAEPHNTSRHINEYVSLDVEMGFIEDHHTVMTLLETVIAGIVQAIDSANKAELTLLRAELPALGRPFPRVHFAEARALVARKGRLDLADEADLSPQAERWLGSWAQREFGSDFLFVTGYPMVKRPFYTHPQPERPAYSNSFDLLFRGTELVTGGQRLHRYADYREALNRSGLPEAPFQTYLEAFRFGMPPHGGFAIGLERFLLQLLRQPNVRLTTLFPRDQGRLTP